MTAAEIFGEGINLMVSGMGFVLVFLLILIWVIGLMSKLVNRYFPDPISPPKTSQNSTALNSEHDDLERLRPVIVAAIAHHRRSQGLS